MSLNASLSKSWSLEGAGMRVGGALLVAAFAIYWAWFVLGPAPLNIHDVHWLWGDLAQVHIAWRQYLSDPDVVWLASSRMSYPEPLSISLFDPMPLLLLLSRPFASIVPAGTQYFGYYFMACLALQGVFAYLAVLAGIKRLGFEEGRAALLVAMLAAILAASIPFTFSRFQGHTALSSQWVLMLSIWVTLTTLDRRGWHWYVPNCGVVFLATGLNPYLAAMVCISAGLMTVSHWRDIGVSEVLRRLAALAAIAVAGLLLFGFMGGATAHSGGYGIYSMNLLGLFDSNGVASLLPVDVPDPTGGQSFEGYTYIGLGVIMLGFLTLLSFINFRAPASGFPFVPAIVIALFCFMLAVSATITLAGHSLKLPLPETIVSLLARFRGTGRFFWMAGFWGLIICVMACSLRFGLRRAALLLLTVSVVQFFDIGAVAVNVRNTIASANALRISGVEAGHYSSVLVFPAWQCDPNGTPGGAVRNYEAIGMLAAELGVPTNNFYAARTPDDQSAFHCDIESRLARLDPKAVYILSGAIHAEYSSQLGSAHYCSLLRPGLDEWKCIPKVR